ncbi:uncharacterized protein LOC144195218 [Stigmatopora nigra]
MATEDMPVVDKETKQRDTMLPSFEKKPETVLGSPIDFHMATPSQFGISVQTFNPSSSKRKEKSRLAQLKERRKSSIGVRGSPEMNTLIRFMARQKLKNSPNCPTPEFLPSTEEKQPEAVSGATARLRKRGKKLPEERKPVRRSTRSAAKPPETIKFTSKAANRWKKEVNHSLYGPREYASKKPVLSPIIELFNFNSAAAQHTSPMTCTEDAREQLEKITFPLTEDSESEVMTDAESIKYAQVNLNEAFREAPLPPEETTEMKSETSQTSQQNSPNEFLPSTEEKQPEAVSGATARLRKRGKKLPEERKPVRRSTRSAAKPPETIKFTSKAANRWKKEVNHFLYGSREYASKKPVLSPIIELFNFNSAAAQHTSPMTCTEIKNEPGDGGPEVAVSKKQSPTRAPLMPKKGGVSKKRRSSRYKVTRCGFKKVSASVDDVREEPQLAEGESREEQIETISALSEEAPAGEEQHSHTLPVGGVHTDTNVEDASTPVCPLVGEQTSAVATPSSRNPVDEEPRQEQNMVSMSDSAKEATQVISCPPFCEEDFNFEDVFKRVPSRGRRSVRRSLRNQINSSDDTGLAWVPQISPEYKNGSGRKTRGRRSSSAMLEDAPYVTV